MRAAISFVCAVAAIACSDGQSPVDGNWSKLEPAMRPPKRTSSAIVATGDQLLLFAGSISPSGGLSNLLADLWSFDGTTWSELATTNPPPARFEHAMAALGSRVILLGGSGGGTSDEMWQLDNGTW